MKVLEAKKVNQRTYIKVDISGEWKLKDFTNVFNSIQNIINIVSHEIYWARLVDDRIPKIRDEQQWNFSIKTFKEERHDYLRVDFSKPLYHYDNNVLVKSIKYSSPGWIEVIINNGGYIAGLISLILHFIPSKKNILEIKSIEQDILKKRIENLERLGFSKAEIKETILRNKIDIGYISRDFRDLIEDDKINSIEIH